MNSLPTVVFLIFCLILLGFKPNKTFAMSCDSCGYDCKRACGTRHFRTCCLNYVRKRSSNFHPYPLNRFNYDFLYGGADEKNIDERTHDEENLINNDVNGLKFYKPWKENEEGILHTQQNSDSKAQLIYDA